MEELSVVMLVELVVLISTLVGLCLGGGSIYWVKVKPCPRRARWGRWLFIITLLSLGLVALLAAILRADGLAPLGLLSGMLIVGMLWEGPVPAVKEDTPM
jgi:hypothetical protein